MLTPPKSCPVWSMTSPAEVASPARDVTADDSRLAWRVLGLGIPERPKELVEGVRRRGFLGRSVEATGGPGSGGRRPRSASAGSPTLSAAASNAGRSRSSAESTLGRFSPSSFPKASTTGTAPFVLRSEYGTSSCGLLLALITFISVVLLEHLENSLARVKCPLIRFASPMGIIGEGFEHLIVRPPLNRHQPG